MDPVFFTFSQGKEDCWEDSHPFYRAIPGITAHKKKKNKMKVNAVGIFAVGKFLISSLYDNLSKT